MAGRRIVVTGASRGLGLEFARRWVQQGDLVFALARGVEAATELAELHRAYPGSVFLQGCDVAKDAAVAAAAAAIEARWDGVDVLLNNAGITGRRARFAELDMADVQRVHDVNVLGPLRLTQRLLPLLRAGRAPRIANMSSRMGSIADDTAGGSWAYRMSKAALNMASRNLAIELQPLGIVVLALHPGWVRTELGGASAPLQPGDVVPGLMRVIESAGAADSGSFLDWEGGTVPW